MDLSQSMGAKFMANALHSFWIAFGLSALFAFPAYKLLIALKSRQTVSQFAPEGHQVKQGTPTMGGIFVVAAIACTLGIAGDFGSLFWVVLLFGAIGFVDDYVIPKLISGKRGLGWKQKLTLELVAAAIISHGSIASRCESTFLILFYANAYNFSDGLDGLAAGIGLILFGWLLPFSSVGINQAAAGAAMGALIPFAFLNAPPAKIFMGDVGSLPLGGLIGCLVWRIAESGGQQGHQDGGSIWAALVLVSLVLCSELVPVPLQIASVKLFKKKLFPYTPIHHAFEKAGWKETRVMAMFVLTQLVLAAVAMSLAFHSIVLVGNS